MVSVLLEPRKRCPAWVEYNIGKLICQILEKGEKDECCRCK